MKNTYIHACVVNLKYLVQLLCCIYIIKYNGAQLGTVEHTVYWESFAEGITFIDVVCKKTFAGWPILRLLDN